MLNPLVMFLIGVTIPLVSSTKNWALLIATANGWENYGMQADVYHAYQILKEGGIPESQIVVMYFDDIANSFENPAKGRVFESYDYKDVYHGLPKDYTGKSVTKETFLAVLRGDKEAVHNHTGRYGKVIESGPDDNVFLFIVNHGFAGGVAWWDHNDLTAKELNNTIDYMHTHKRYSKMLIYIDTCFSGSMFRDILPPNIGVYAVTAANSKESAWSTDCFGIFNPPTCLGGLFSISWIYQSQSVDRNYTSLQMQYEEAKWASQGKNQWCHPMQYGNLSIAKLSLATFFGDSSNNEPTQINKANVVNVSFVPRRSLKYHKRMSISSGHLRSSTQPRKHRRDLQVMESPIPKHLISYELLKHRLSKMGNSRDSEEYQNIARKLQRMEHQMAHADDLIRDVFYRVYGPQATEEDYSEVKARDSVINWNCYTSVLEAFRQDCVINNEVRYYTMSQFGVLVNMCHEYPAHTVVNALKQAVRINTLCQG